jgi:PLP dependent protein
MPDTSINNNANFDINNIAAQAVFTPARVIFDQLDALDFGLDTLSIGMSADLESAILAGSTMVRVGSAIFGARG